MRSIIVIVVLLLLMRYGTGLPVTHSVLESGQDGGSSIGTLATSVLMGGLPLLGVFALFRAFFRWHRGLHNRMRTDGLGVSSRKRTR